jgi:outer membrane protein assembly factor BamA
LAALYYEAGYYKIEISDISVLPNGDKEITLNEGEPAKVAALSVQLLPPDSSIQLNEIISEFTGQVASQATLNDFADDCIAMLSDNGMPFASGQWLDFSLDGNSDIIATFKILPGPRSRVAGPKFTGVKRTKPHLLYKSLTYASGELFSDSRIVESERLINQMPYVDIIAPFTIEPIADGESLYIVHNIQELPSTRFNGAGGLITVKGRETFIGRLDLEFGDILGTGRVFGFIWNRKDSWSGELSLSYLEPYIMGSEFDLKMEIAQLNQDTSFIRSNGRIGLLRSFHSGLAGALWLGLERTVPEHGVFVSPTPDNSGRSTAKIITASFDYDRTNDRQNPRSGHGLSSGVSHKYRTNTVDSSASTNLPRKITSAGFSVRYYAGLSRRVIAALGIHGWGIVSIDGRTPREEVQFIPMGPESSGDRDVLSNLRGYPERRFAAHRYFVATIEPRLLTDNEGRLYAFLDMAYIYLPGQINSSQSNKSDYTFYPGYGLGLTALSTLGQFKIEIGWGKTGFPGDGVIGFGLAGRF